MENNNKLKKVEETLESLEGIKRASPGPFFYTRVRAALDNNLQNSWERISSFIAKPAIALMGICIILLLNAAAFFYHTERTSKTLADQSEISYSYMDDYNANVNNGSVYYEDNNDAK